MATTESALCHSHLVLVDIAHHSVGVSHFRNVAQVLAGVPLTDFTHIARLVVGGREILQVTVKGVRVGRIRNENTTVDCGVFASQKVGASHSVEAHHSDGGSGY